MRAFIVIDLGFGDAGKGLVTDHLVRREHASIVLRFNGGAQAGHNVVAPDGRHHTFAQFGAGTFVGGVRTWLTREMVVHPTALLGEADALRERGVSDALARLRVSDQARIVTPYHQAANRIRERVRGRARHGSCGVGIGETVADALSHPDDAIVAGDLYDRARLRDKLVRTARRKHAELSALVEGVHDRPDVIREWRVFAPEVFETWLERVDAVRAAGVVVPDEALGEALSKAGCVVFEGAQGVLLDERFGFHPHTTWSRCTFDPALEVLQEHGISSDVTRLGVLRTHAVRHGAGPLPTETPELVGCVPDHNVENAWQGRVRYGWFDVVLARYALEAVGGVDHLAVTHADLLQTCASWRAAVKYRARIGDDDLDLVEQEGQHTVRLVPPVRDDLERQSRLTRLLQRVEPVLETSPADETMVLEAIAQRLEQRVGLVSRGRRAQDVQVAWRPAR